MTPRPIMFQFILALSVACVAPPAKSFAAGEKPGPPVIVTIETRDLAVEFAGDRAWTISRIVHQGKVITDRTGFYGTVFSPEGGKWIGTGHNEGGVEKIEIAALTVDGKPCDLTDKAIYRGQRAELCKLYSHAAIASGTKFEAHVVMRCSEADAASWKEKARLLAKETRMRYEKGDIRY